MGNPLLRLLPSFKLHRHGFTLMEVILTIGLLAIFGVFVLEFLTTAWLGTEKDFARIKCIAAAENIVEMAGAMGIVNSDDSLETTVAKILAASDFPAPALNVATWTPLVATAAVHPDRYSSFMARIATEPGNIGTFSLFVGDVGMANVIEIKTGYATQSVLIDYNLDTGI
jgi:prepilin-type N-terminal cleavage/methylation domain-containing protein